MITNVSLRLLPHQAASDATLRLAVADQLKIDARTITSLRIRRRSIDARQRTVYVNLSVRVYISQQPDDDEFLHTDYHDVSHCPQVIVVGAGPAGLFAALRLIELHLKPIVLERGKDVHQRKLDLAAITREQKVNPQSNYCFGEGGAGAYSDGKLYTRSKKRGNVDKILSVFCQHGADTRIMADAHPHIGTDRLPRVIENMRNTIMKAGGEVHFSTLMTSLVINQQKVVGARTRSLSDGTQREWRGPVILATGHSARDVYEYLHSNQIEVQPKGIAVGVRLEHPSALIDQIQYHNPKGRGRYLPAAEYAFVTQVEGRGVYSFCMCPGGFVIPAATDDGQIVVNGMSPSNRGTQWSNSGMVVELHPEDVLSYMEAERDDPLLMMRFQQRLEHDCFIQGNRRQTAPAQRMADFVNGRLSYDLPTSSYAPGLISSPLHFWMPQFVTRRLQQAFTVFGQRSRGFLTNEATLIAVETRTSSPVRIVRDEQSLQHIHISGLFPCGEGAGYAGGIVSAGIDGERCADACAQYLFLQ